MAKAKPGRFFKTSPTKVQVKVTREKRERDGLVEVTVPANLGVGVYPVTINGTSYELRYGVATRVPASVAQLLKDNGVI